MSDGISNRIGEAASILTLPAALTRNVSRAAEAILEIRDQLASLVDLPREILDQLRAMQELAERMTAIAEELHSVAKPMLETAEGIHELATPMLQTGQNATRAAEEARDAVLRTNDLIEQTLKIAAPIQRVQERGERLGARLRRQPKDRTPET